MTVPMLDWGVLLAAVGGLGSLACAVWISLKLRAIEAKLAAAPPAAAYVRSDPKPRASQGKWVRP